MQDMSRYQNVSSAALLQLEAFALEQSGNSKDIELANKLLSEAAELLVDLGPQGFNDLGIKSEKYNCTIIVGYPQDLTKIIKLAKKKNIVTMLDNTWGTPLYLKFHPSESTESYKLHSASVVELGQGTKLSFNIFLTPFA